MFLLDLHKVQRLQTYSGCIVQAVQLNRVSAAEGWSSQVSIATIGVDASMAHKQPIIAVFSMNRWNPFLFKEIQIPHGDGRNNLRTHTLSSCWQHPIHKRPCICRRPRQALKILSMPPITTPKTPVRLAHHWTMLVSICFSVTDRGRCLLSQCRRHQTNQSCVSRLLRV